MKIENMIWTLFKIFIVFNEIDAVILDKCHRGDEIFSMNKYHQYRIIIVFRAVRERNPVY
jgi:hypothetical protein